MSKKVKISNNIKSLLSAARPPKIKETIIFSVFALLLQTSLQITFVPKLGTQAGAFGILSVAIVTWFGNIKRGLLFSLIAGSFTTIFVYEVPLFGKIPSVESFVFGIAVISSAVLITGVLRYLMMRLHAAEEKLRREYEKSNMLLHNILPAKIADRLKNGEQLIADRYEIATILFCDLVGFTSLAEELKPEDIVKILNRLVSDFDKLSDRYCLEKIKTIGDAYLVVAGLPEHRIDHAIAICDMALDMTEVVETVNQELNLGLKVRIGIHSGPVVGGVIGQKKFTFDLWGDTVNVAARLESHGVPGKIQISEVTRALILKRFEAKERGEIELRNHSRIKTWFLSGRKQMI